MNKMNKWFVFVITIGVSLLVGFLGGLITAPAIGTWYAGLIRPAFSPPDYLFGPRLDSFVYSDGN